MIIVRITSGLGNQMYQYNFYKLMKERYPEVPVKADITWFYANDEHHGYELERVYKHKDSSFDIDIASTKDIYKVTGQIPNFCKGALGGPCQFLLGPVNRILREKIHPDFECNKIDRLEDDKSNHIYDEVMNLDASKDWYLFGFWIEEPFYRDRLSKLKSEFAFRAFTDEANKELSDKMSATNSVSIHVRRGDYLSATYSDKFLSLGAEYYKKAVEIIKEKITDPRFFIFSDDADFVKKEFTWLENATIVTNNTGKDSYKDMQLMSLCKHNIIANSTFSQWGALLNVNDEHLTIYPATYMKDEDSEVKTMSGYIRV